MRKALESYMEGARRLVPGPSPHSAGRSSERQKEITALTEAAKALVAAGDVDEQRALVDRAAVLVARAWRGGREPATQLCDALRIHGALDSLFELLRSPKRNLRLSAAGLLGQVLTTQNR